MREPWKIPDDFSSRHLACSAAGPITLPRRIRAKANVVQPVLSGGKRARGRIGS